MQLADLLLAAAFHKRHVREGCIGLVCTVGPTKACNDLLLMGPAEPCRLEGKQTNKQTNKQVHKFNQQTNTQTNKQNKQTNKLTHKSKQNYKMLTCHCNFITLLFFLFKSIACVSADLALFLFQVLAWCLAYSCLIYSARHTIAIGVQSPAQKVSKSLDSAANLSQLCSSQCTGHEFPSCHLVLQA
jgi:hypothetical protein